MIFEGYQTGEEIAWGEESTVYAAIKEGADQLAIKTRAYLHESDGTLLLDSAHAQKAAVEAGCSSVAPVYACGVAQRYFFCVTRRYSRSVLSLIQGKLAVQPEGLHSLTTHVLSALRELRDKAGRWHGNLKPSNILLMGTARLRDSTVYLSDPAPGAGSDHASDVQALGRAIFQLVRRREVHNIDWPIAATPEWNALGPQGSKWREICNALLDPSLSQQSDPIAAAEKAVQSIESGPTKGRAGAKLPLWPIAAALVLLGGAVGAWRFFSRGHSSNTTPSASVSAPADGPITRLAGELKSLPSVQTDDSYLNDQVLAPLRRPDLTPDVLHGAGAALDSWPGRKVIDQAYDDYAARGWTIPAGALSRLRGSFSNSQPVIDQLRARAQAAQLAPQIDAKWRALQGAFADAEKTGDSVLSKAPGFFKSDAGQVGDLPGLLARLEADRDRLASLVALAGSANRERMSREGKLAGRQVAQVDDSILRDWKSDARRFQPGQTPSGPGGPAAPPTLPTAEATQPTAAATNVAKIETAPPAQTQPAQTPTIASIANNSPPPPSKTALPAIPETEGQIFSSLVAKFRTGDLNDAAAARGLRDEFLNEVRQRTSPVFQAKVGDFLTSLAGLHFDESAASTGPQIPGWQGPAPTPSGIAYTWGRYSAEFALIPADGRKAPFYLASTEMPIGLVIEWMNARGSDLASMGIASEPTVVGPRGWEPRGRGLGLRADWTWPTSMTAFPFYSPAAKPEPPSPLSPINYISVHSAIALAASMGFRLPTADEWERAYQFAKSRGWEGGPGANLRDLHWEAQRKYLADCVTALRAKGAELRDPPWPDSGIFLPVATAKGAAARPAVEDDDDNLFFAPVDPSAAKKPGVKKPLNHLIGNVAEYVSDDANASQAGVIGGSALSPAEVNPSQFYPLNAAQKKRGYSDVGFRPALSPAARGTEGQAHDLEVLRKLLQTAPSGA